MNYYMDFDPYMIREVNALRLEKRLQDNGGPSISRFFALAGRGLVPLLRRVRVVG